MPRTVYEIGEPWTVAVGGTLYANKVGQPASEWKATIDAWPEALGNDIRMCDLTGLVLEGSASHIIKMLRSMLEQMEMLEATYLEDKLVVRKQPPKAERSKRRTKKAKR